MKGENGTSFDSVREFARRRTRSRGTRVKIDTIGESEGLLWEIVRGGFFSRYLSPSLPPCSIILTRSYGRFVYNDVVSYLPSREIARLSIISAFVLVQRHRFVSKGLYDHV